MKRIQSWVSAIPSSGRLGAIVGAFIASLCCVGPLLTAALGLLSIPVAGALAGQLFWHYWWAFIGAGVFITWVSVAKMGEDTSCPIGPVAQRSAQRRNALLATLILFAVLYLVWDYIIVEFIGIKMHLWAFPPTR